MEAGTVYGGYYGTKGYEGVRKEEKRADAGREKKARQKELLEEYLEKRTQAKRQQQELLNEKAAKAEQQMAKVSSSYESNIMTETVAGGEVK